MDILEAMAILTSTEKRIRRKGWTMSLVYCKHTDRIAVVDFKLGVLTKYHPTGEDMLAGDWEILC